jgi:opacity protein-like surface antigen
MKRSIFGVAALALVLSASAAKAQRPVSFGIALGASMPSGDLSDAEEMGYHAMASLGFSPPALPVGLRIDGMLNQFTGKTYTESGVSVKGGDLRVIALLANATFGMPMAASPISPYLIGGLGMYMSSDPKAEDDPATPEEEGKGTSDMGFNVGVGTKFSLAGFGTFAEVRYHKIMVGDKDPVTGKKPSISFIPITVGITF